MQAIVYDIKPLGWATCKWLRHLWRGCLVSGLNGVSLREIPVPELPGEDWVVAKTLLGGLCGTDIAILAQKQKPNSILQAYGSMPMLMGHENVAIVERVGKDVDASWVGKRVCVEPTLGCEARGIEPKCPRCAVGEFGSCEHFGADGIGRAKLPAGTSIGYNSRTGGSYGEYFVAHKSQLVEVPENVSDEQAVLTDPAACSLHGVLRSDYEHAKHVLVYGAGAIGLTLVAVLRAIGYGGRIDVVEISEAAGRMACELGADEWVRLGGSQRERFEKIGERTGAAVKRARFGNYMLSGGYDIAFDCVGNRQSLQESLKWTRARGQMVMIATGDGMGVDLTPIWFRELEVLGAYGRQMERFGGREIGTYPLVHELMASGKLKLDGRNEETAWAKSPSYGKEGGLRTHPTKGLLTHTFRVGDYRRAFMTALDKGRHGAMKVAFDFR